MIKTIIPELIEQGSIKIGMKGEKKISRYDKEFQQPVKIDHFLLTTRERGPDDNLIPDTELMDEIKKHPLSKTNTDGNLIELPVMLMYNDPELNLFSRLAAYDGKRLACSGDGEQATAQNKKRVCPCPWKDPDEKGVRKCKPFGKLVVMLMGVPSVGGCHVFRTTSYNSIKSLLASMGLFRQITGGILAGIPMKMVLVPKTVQLEGQKIAQSTIRVVGLIHPGSPEALQSKALEIQRRDHNFLIEMKTIEKNSRLMIEQIPDDPEENLHISDEYYPETTGGIESPEPEPENKNDFPDKNQKTKPVDAPEPDAEKPDVGKEAFVPPTACGNTKCASYTIFVRSHCDDPTKHGSGNYLFPTDSASKSCEEFQLLGGKDKPTISNKLEMKRLEKAKSTSGIHTPKGAEQRWALYEEYYRLLEEELNS